MSNQEMNNIAHAAPAVLNSALPYYKKELRKAGYKIYGDDQVVCCREIAPSKFLVIELCPVEGNYSLFIFEKDYQDAMYQSFELVPALHFFIEALRKL